MDKKNRKRLLWIVALVVLAGLFWGLSRPKPINIELYTVDRGTVEMTVANTRSGTVKACQRSKLSMPIGGQIETIHVQEGDEVVAGQPLITLWNADRTAAVELERARLESAVQDHEVACITSRSDRTESNRSQALVKQGLASKEVADRAAAKASASQAACAAAGARERQAEAGLSLAKATLEQTVLTAPFAGTVAEVTGELGEFATPSPPGIPTPPAIDLLTHGCHYITAPIDEVDAALVSLGQTARVSMDAFRGREFPGTVRRIAPYVLDLEKQARTVDVEAELGIMPEGVNLLAGYSADLEIIIETREDVTRVPTELLLEEKYVLVVNSEDTLERQEVSTGISNWTFTEISSGLQPGDRIVRSVGQSGVEAGALVEVTGPTDD
jgi:HlyD family secretion protein